MPCDTPGVKTTDSITADWWNRGPLLSECLRSHRFQINAIRLALAIVVIVYHIQVNRIGGGPVVLPSLHPYGQAVAGTLAVGAFFSLSGMMVTISARHRSGGQYLLARLLRIAPAYIVVLVVSAFVLAPIIYFDLHHSFGGFQLFAPKGPIAYVINDAALSLSTWRWGILDVFQAIPGNNPQPFSIINGSLWSIPVEVRCYVIALLLVIVGRRVGGTTAMVAGAGIFGFATIAYHLRPEMVVSIAPDFLAPIFYQWVLVFLCGAIAGTLADRIRLTPLVSVVVVCVFAALMIWGGHNATLLAYASCCLVIPVVARWIPRRIVRIFRNDVSYGTYLWGFPVSQTLAYMGLVAYPVLFIGGAIAVSIAIATISWVAIERPALRLKPPASLSARPTRG